MDKLYHECHEAISQARLIFEDFHQRGVRSFDLDAHSSSSECQQREINTSLPETLEALEAELIGCCLCPLSQKRNNIVFGSGNPGAELVFVGEAPGREEDIKGYPFVGEAGHLLEKMLFAMGLARADVYICNVIKCRPPNNRDPQNDEIATCEPFLKQQLALIRPKIIIALGRFAAQTLLNNKSPISRMRGQWNEYEGIPLMPTYHPAYLLRNPSGKREVWEDLKQVMGRLKLT